MSATTSTKPYLIRAIYEWCVDQGFTPRSFLDAWQVCDTVEEAMAVLQRSDEAPHLKYDQR